MLSCWVLSKVTGHLQKASKLATVHLLPYGSRGVETSLKLVSIDHNRCRLSWLLPGGGTVCPRLWLKSAATVLQQFSNSRLPLGSFFFLRELLMLSLKRLIYKVYNYSKPSLCFSGFSGVFLFLGKFLGKLLLFTCLIIAVVTYFKIKNDTVSLPYSQVMSCEEEIDTGDFIHDFTEYKLCTLDSYDYQEELLSTDSYSLFDVLIALKHTKGIRSYKQVKTESDKYLYLFVGALETAKPNFKPDDIPGKELDILVPEHPKYKKKQLWSLLIEIACFLIAIGSAYLLFKPQEMYLLTKFKLKALVVIEEIPALRSFYLKEHLKKVYLRNHSEPYIGYSSPSVRSILGDHPLFDDYLPSDAEIEQRRKEREDQEGWLQVEEKVYKTVFIECKRLLRTTYFHSFKEKGQLSSKREGHEIRRVAWFCFRKLEGSTTLSKDSRKFFKKQLEELEDHLANSSRKRFIL